MEENSHGQPVVGKHRASQQLVGTMVIPSDEDSQAFSVIFASGTKALNQILAKQGPASRIVVEANSKPLLSKSSSRRSQKVMIRGLSIRPRSEYRSEY